MLPFQQSCHTPVKTVFLVLVVFLLTAHEGMAQKKRSRRNDDARPLQELLLADQQTSRYRIVLPSSPTAMEKKAADVLRKYVLDISGAALPILTAAEHRTPFEILLGRNDRLDDLAADIDFHALGDDGFVIRTDSMRLVIAGGSGKGTLYGVFSFLEKYLGCRLYSPTVKLIPRRERIALGSIDDRQVPVIAFRDTHYRVTWDAEYTDWHKLDHNEKGERSDWGMWVHTFNALVPPEKFYDEHPEYFAMVKGKRIPTQLCLANPEVLQITIRNLRKKIAENPAPRYWSVSQNDNRDYCTCEKCKAVDDREGSPSGSIVQFVNKVAEHFPDKIISTLAYEYGRHAPRSLKPRENVNIMLCSIEVPRNLPIAEDSASADFAEDVKAWGKIASDIIVWDYVIQFNHLISPFPNLHILQPNIRFFVDNGVSAMFEQGNREVGGEFAGLRAYLISKLLWNPDEDVNVLMNDFLHGYYGAAGPAIRKYIDALHEALQVSGAPLRIFGSPMEAESSYLSPELMIKYQAYFDEAEAMVAGDEQILERVRIARLPLEYAMLEQAKKHFYGPKGVFQEKDGRWVARPDLRAKIDPFADLCVRQGVTQVKEWSTSPEEYRAAMYRLLSQGMNEHLAFGKKVTFISPDTTKLPAGATAMLTDGVRGSHDYSYNWLAFPGQNLEAVIDLGEVRTVRRMEAAFYQYAFWLRILPSEVAYFTSSDGVRYELAGVVKNSLPIDQYGGHQRDFILEFLPRQARFVKVRAATIGNTPGWHPGGGRPAHMLVDEVVVE